MHKRGFKKLTLEIPFIWLSLLLIFFLAVGERYINYGYFYQDTPDYKAYYILKYIIVFVAIYVTAFGVDRAFVYLFRFSYDIKISDKKLYLSMVMILLLLWLPYFIALFPGSAWYDCGGKISMFFGETSYYGTHPIFQTFLMGISVKTGLIIGNANYGVAIYCLFQMVVAAAVISMGVIPYYLRSKRIAVLIISIAFWGINPMIPLHLLAMGVDSNWSIIFLGIYILINESRQNEKIILKLWFMPLFLLLLILFCLLRNAGIFFVALFALLLISYCHSQIKEIFITTIVAIAVVYIFNAATTVMLDVNNSLNSRPSYTIPVIQMARYVGEYEDEITDSEKEIINRVFDYDTFVNEYKPQIVDYVIGTYKLNAKKQEKQDFFKLWLKYFIRHPMVYFDAIGAKSIGYYNPFDKGEVKPFVIIGLGHISERVESELGIPLYNIFNLESIQTFVQNLSQIPIIRMITRCGFWMWLLIFSIVGGIVRHRQKRIFVPMLIFALGLIAMPANAYFRYILPIVFVAPYLLFYTYVESVKISSGGSFNAN
jgi:hypothetical protein